MPPEQDVAFEIELGSEVQHIITGFRGVVIGRTQWISGCNRYVVQARELQKSGDPIEARSFDYPELKVLGAPKSDMRKIVEAGAAAKPLRKTGGPHRVASHHRPSNTRHGHPSTHR